MRSSPPVRRRIARQAAVICTLGALGATGVADYTVRKGDTLWTIARRSGTSVSSLASANGITAPYVIFPGQTLQLSGSGGGTQHRVAAGETLSGLASRYGVRVSDLASANAVDADGWVYAGQRLNIPSRQAAAAAAGSSSRAEVATLIEQVSRQYGWNPAMVKALAMHESGWNNQVVSSAGAIGIMQVLPGTNDFVSRHLVGRSLDLSDPRDNIEAGVAFLDYLYRLTGGDVEMLLGGYYQGLASIRQNGMYHDTRAYIRNVLALRERY